MTVFNILQDQSEDKLRGDLLKTNIVPAVGMFSVEDGNTRLAVQPEVETVETISKRRIKIRGFRTKKYYAGDIRQGGQVSRSAIVRDEKV